jgi:hypothetical protein
MSGRVGKGSLSMTLIRESLGRVEWAADAARRYFFHRLAAAVLAISARCFGVNALARARPPRRWRLPHGAEYPP